MTKDSEKTVKGYKATDKNMQCRGFQFELGKWHKHDGQIAMCESGFHFCEYPSGPWSFYNNKDTRIFKVEARGVLKGDGPGADLKHVAMEIRLVEEIVFTGDGNTGDRNTGDGNTGDRNTGDGNTGDRNTGDRNTGHRNTGDRNTGHRNTGYENTGDENTGDGNTGHRNTGHRNTGDGNTGDENTGDGNTGDRNTGDGNTGDGNTGDRNTGDGNTGDRNTGYGNTGDGNTGYGNTGDGNATDRCSGFLCLKKQPIVIFDEPCNDNDVPYWMINDLSLAMQEDEPIKDIERYLEIPNSTIEKITTLHAAHIARRKKS